MTIRKITPPADLGELPEVRLLDARPAALDAAQLRAWARAETAAVAAPYLTRSYRYPYALIAWHDQPVGVDIERIETCTRDFAASICTPMERADRSFHTLDAAHVTSVWCSKEALAKALGDATRYDPRRLESPIRWPDGQAGPWHAAALTVPDHHTAWLCWQTGGGMSDTSTTKSAYARWSDRREAHGLRGTCWPDSHWFLPPPLRSVHAILPHTARRRSSPSAFRSAGAASCCVVPRRWFR